MSKTGIIEVEAIFQASTERAVCVKADEKSKEDVWFPLSQVEVHGASVRGKVVTLVGPERLFNEKGLI